jgi:hypothetical protein
MTKTFNQKLRQSGLVSPESDAITRILTKDKNRTKPHRHKWFTPEGGTLQRCRKPLCPARREIGGQ